MSHAVLSASAAHRWMHCPPSARLAIRCKDTGSVYAAEGTAAHALAEARLGSILENYGIDCGWSRSTADTDNEYYGPEMEENIAGYAAVVLETVMNASSSPYVLLEQRLDFSEYVPHGFGTGDVIILADDALEIIDLKYGKGVAVDAHRNPQLMLYGLGALLTFGQIYDVKTVRMTVIQPRLDSISRYALPADELLQWAENEIRPVALEAWKGKGKFQAGDWCQFCPAAGDCRERARVNMELAKAAFTDPPTLRDDEIGDLLTKLPEWESWAKSFKERALERALHEGAHYPGFKLVLGRSTRKYTDAQAVTRALVEAGYDIDAVSPREPLGVTAMTKLVGRKGFTDILGDLIYMSTGKPTLVPETDKRKEYVPETAGDVFRNYTESADETGTGD